MAIDDSTKILEISSTNKTLKINRGHLDNLKPGSRATLMLESNGQWINLGIGEAIKVYNGYSYWSMREPITVQIQANQPILLRESLEFWGGLKTPEISRKTIIGKRKKTEDYLTRHEDEYLVQSEVAPQKEERADKKTLLEYKNQIKRENEQNEIELVPGKTQKNVSNEKFTEKFKEKREQDFYEAELSDLEKLDLEEIHAPKNYSGSESEKNKIIAKEQKEKIKLIVENKTKQRADWSDDLSDEELVNFIRRNGVDFEEKRRISLMSKKYTMELTASLGFKLNDSNDPNQGQAATTTKRDFGMGLEYYLSTHFDKLRKFSLEADYKSGNDSARVGSTNNAINSTTFGLNAFFYPFHYPALVNRNLFFIGTGYRRGSANLENSLGTSAYAVTVMPIMHVGFRYHFENQFGMRVIGSFETFNLSNQSLNSENTNTATYQALKLGVGISYYF